MAPNKGNKKSGVIFLGNANSYYYLNENYSFLFFDEKLNPNNTSIKPKILFIISDQLKSNTNPTKTFAMISIPHTNMISLWILCIAQFKNFRTRKNLQTFFYLFGLKLYINRSFIIKKPHKSGAWCVKIILF